MLNAITSAVKATIAIIVRTGWICSQGGICQPVYPTKLLIVASQQSIVSARLNIVMTPCSHV